MKLYIITITETFKDVPVLNAPIICLCEKQAKHTLTLLKKRKIERYRQLFKKKIKLECVHVPGAEVAIYPISGNRHTSYTATIHEVNIAQATINEATIKRMEKKFLKKEKDLFKDFYLMPMCQRKGITDSLLLESGIIVAEGSTDEFSFHIVTQGHIRIIYKDEVYKNGGDYPDELTELIRNHTVDSHPDVIIDENNWYELVIKDKKGNTLYAELADIDLSTITVEEIREMVIDSFDSVDIN